jgi:hypothetical protein
MVLMLGTAVVMQAPAVSEAAVLQADLEQVAGSRVRSAVLWVVRYVVLPLVQVLWQATAVREWVV